MSRITRKPVFEFSERPGPKQTGLYSLRRWLGLKFCGFRKNSDYTTMYLCSENKDTVTVQLICAFVFVYVKSRFSRDMAQLNHSTRVESVKPVEKNEFHTNITIGKNDNSSCTYLLMYLQR